MQLFYLVKELFTNNEKHNILIEVEKESNGFISIGFMIA